MKDEEKVKIRWRGEETVSLPWAAPGGVVLAKGDVVELPASLVNVDGDPNAAGFYFPADVWSYVDAGLRKRAEAAAKAAAETETNAEAPAGGEGTETPKAVK